MIIHDDSGRRRRRRRPRVLHVLGVPRTRFHSRTVRRSSRSVNRAKKKNASAISGMSGIDAQRLEDSNLSRRNNTGTREEYIPCNFTSFFRGFFREGTESVCATFMNCNFCHALSLSEVQLNKLCCIGDWTYVILLFGSRFPFKSSVDCRNRVGCRGMTLGCPLGLYSQYETARDCDVSINQPSVIRDSFA